jgi:hypothetical protein
MAKIPKKLHKKAAAAVVGMAHKAMELGWSPNTPAEEARKAVREPKFVYVKMEQIWGPWRRRGGKGNAGGFLLRWGAEGVGFGEMQFSFKRGRMYCDTECMGMDFIRAAFDHFLKNEVLYDAKEES